jgi:DNA (cytosine-5)-methyltransferase 1
MPKEMKPTVGSLFAGIGGFDLGFTRAGFDVSWQVEIDSWCRKVLAKHFPESERFEDVRTVGKHNLSRVDVIVGGFPCQDISNAGLRAGIGGERSGLWSEMHRIIRELQPHFVLVENVAALLGRGMGRVLGDLAALGYDAEWEVVSAADVGAPHLRERVWVLAYPKGFRSDGSREAWEVRFNLSPRRCSGKLADASGERCGEARELRHNQSSQWATGGSEDVRDTASEGLPHGAGEPMGQPSAFTQLERPMREVSDAHSHDVQGLVTSRTDTQEWSEPRERQAGPCDAGAGGQWSIEPNVGRVAHGVPQRVDRLRGLGNAVVPQIPELYAKRIKHLLEGQ